MRRLLAAALLFGGLLFVAGNALAFDSAALAVATEADGTVVWSNNLQTWIVTFITLGLGASAGTLWRVARGVAPYIPGLPRDLAYLRWLRKRDEAAGAWPPPDAPPPPPDDEPPLPLAGVLDRKKRRDS